MNNLLIFLFVLPLTFSLFFFFIPRFQIHLIKNLSLFYSIFLFFYSLILLTRFDILNAGFQFKVIFTLFFGFNAVFGIDGISLFFILLTTFLMPIVILVNWESVKYRIKDFTILLFFLEFLLISMFISLDLLFFYIFFEGVLIPMFLIIGIWGSRSRKLHAAYQFFFYTFFGSILMLVAFITIYLHTGSTNLEVVLSTSFSAARQIFL